MYTRSSFNKQKVVRDKFEWIQHNCKVKTIKCLIYLTLRDSMVDIITLLFCISNRTYFVYAGVLNIVNTNNTIKSSDSGNPAHDPFSGSVGCDRTLSVPNHNINWTKLQVASKS